MTLSRALLPVLVMVLVAGCTRRPQSGLPPGVEAEDLPESESWNVQLRTTLDGTSQSEIESPYLARFTGDSSYVYLGPPPGDTLAAVVALRLFDDEGQPRGQIQAREIWLYESGSFVVAEGATRIVVSGSDGATVQADRLEIEDEAVTATGSVRAEVPGASVQAPRLTLADGGAFTATGGVSARLTDANATVRAQSVRGVGDRYTAEGSARVQTSGGRTLRASRVVWDESARLFTAPGSFSFDGPSERARGVGLEASADLSRYSFRQASGEIEVRE